MRKARGKVNFFNPGDQSEQEHYAIGPGVADFVASMPLFPLVNNDGILLLGTLHTTAVVTFLALKTSLANHYCDRGTMRSKHQGGIIPTQRFEELFLGADNPRRMSPSP